MGDVKLLEQHRVEKVDKLIQASGFKDQTFILSDMATRCLLCKKPPTMSAVFVIDPPESEAWGALPGKTRIVPYALCEKHFKRAKKIEKRLRELVLGQAIDISKLQTEVVFPNLPFSVRRGKLLFASEEEGDK